MEKNNKNFKNIIWIILILFVAYWTVNNISNVGDIISNLFNIIFPFFLGACLAFVLNIPMTFFENKFLKIKKGKKTKKKKTKGLRIVSILFAIIVISLVLTLIIRLIVPELIEVVKTLINNIPYYVEEISKFANNYSKDFEIINNQIKNIDEEEIKNQVFGLIPNVLTSSISIIGNVFKGISTFFIAIVFAIYILLDKENLKMQTKKMLKVYLKRKNAIRIIKLGRITKNTFKRFFTVQCLEAAILGTLCIIGMWILKMPYAVSIGILVGVTALIPVVGAFLGAIIGAILIVAIEPVKVITFVIFILVLQQVEGNLIYPRVVGSSVGLPGMWVLFAVTVGGSIGGVVGMLIGVPIATVIYTLIQSDIQEKLKGDINV